MLTKMHKSFGLPFRLVWFHVTSSSGKLRLEFTLYFMHQLQLCTNWMNQSELATIETLLPIKTANLCTPSRFQMLCITRGACLMSWSEDFSVVCFCWNCTFMWFMDHDTYISLEPKALSRSETSQELQMLSGQHSQFLRCFTSTQCLWF